MMEGQRFTERRVINKLCSYWNSLRGDRLYPEKGEIEPGEIAECWPYCFIIEIKDDQNYECVYIGEKAAEIYSSDILKINAEKEGSNFMLESLYPYIEELLSNPGEPIIEESESVNGNGNFLKTRQCLLPLGTSKKLEYVIGAIGCKLY